MFEENILGSRYLLVKQLGQGSFGKTYLAKDTMLPGSPLCVVKQLHPIFNDSEVLEMARRLFETEAKALQKLGDRERIPQLLAYFEQNQEFYLVQQYIEGTSLIEQLIPGQPWPEEKVIQMLKNCLNTLDYIHSHGVIHRDVKPANLIIRRQDNKLVLVDFGAVKEVIQAKARESSIFLTPATVAIGTRGYMPQEQAMGNPCFNSDIYALGVIAIQALTGCPPLELNENRQGELVWKEHAKVSRPLAKILSKMIRYNFKQRYKSASEAIAAIDAINNKPTTIYQNGSKNKGSTTIIETTSFSSKGSEIKANNLSTSLRKERATLDDRNYLSSSVQTLTTEINNSSIEPKAIQFCQQQLADRIGPLSTFIIRDILTRNPQITLEQFIEQLARRIPNPDVAKQFTTIVEKSLPKTEINPSSIDPKAIEFCRRELGNYVGSLSRFITQDILTKNPQISLEQLIEQLAAEIPDRDLAKQFTTIVEKSLPKTKINDNSIDPKAIEFCQQELANYVGSLSRFIVRDILDKNPHITLEQFIDRLAAEIPDRKLAREFLKVIEKSLPKTEIKNSAIDSSAIEFCQRELANFVGPLSRFIVKDVLAKNPQISLEPLIEKLAAEIPDPNEAKKFLKKIEKSLPKTEIKNSSLDSDAIEVCQQELADFVGPLSRFIVKDVLAKNSPITLQKLIEKLADEIPDSDEAKQFKKNLISRF
ncbi:MAG: protein kinase [Prochloraceae cyanobacterium]